MLKVRPLAVILWELYINSRHGVVTKKTGVAIFGVQILPVWTIQHFDF